MVSYFDKNTKKTWVGVSSDVKPLNTPDNKQVVNGSIFYEMDTSEIFMFDEDGNMWWPQVSTTTEGGV